MKTTPLGKMSSDSAFIAPGVGPASAPLPSPATITASDRPITTCVEREMTMGHASSSRARSDGTARGGVAGVVRLAEVLTGERRAAGEEEEREGAGGPLCHTRASRALPSRHTEERALPCRARGGAGLAVDG